MACTSPNKPDSRLGFTLVEMLIVAPVIILTITVFIAVMVNMVGDVIRAHGQNDLAYQTQTALDQIEQDALMSSEFLSTTGTLRTYQGRNNNFAGTSSFTSGSSNTLILHSITTNINPGDANRTPVYYANEPYPCGTQQTFNEIVHAKIIYFVKDSTLWRRTVLPSGLTNGDVCGSLPWQKDSCSPGHPSASQCLSDDMELMNGISSLSVNYFINPGDTATVSSSRASEASTIRVTITGEGMAAGRDISSQGMIRATKLNSL